MASYSTMNTIPADVESEATLLNNTLIYDSARDPKDAKGAYKLWRADGSAGGFFTVELDCKKSSVYKCQLQMTCRDNADWDTLSDDC